MNRLKKIIKRLFFLPPWLTVLIDIPSFLLVIVIRNIDRVGAVLYYASYLLSVYAAVITVTAVITFAKTVSTGTDNLPVVKKIKSYPLGERYLSDNVFRSQISLYAGLSINLLYAAIKMYSGIYYRSVWFIALAIYYILLSAMRFILLSYLRKIPIGRDFPAELRCYRICGIVLLFMNQALIGIVVYIVTENKGFSYPGILIYAMAAYTVYIIVSAVVNLVRYRKLGSPVLSAAKVVNLTAALVSLLSLETAILAKLGGEDSIFRRIVIAILGGIISLIVLSMAIYMIIRSTKLLKKHADNNTALR